MLCAAERSLQNRETQTESGNAASVDVQTEQLFTIRSSQSQTETLATKSHGAQTEQAVGRNLHVQTDLEGPVRPMQDLALLRNGVSQTEEPESRVDRDCQTDVSCLNKNRPNKRELLLKSREPSDESGSLQLKHGHREITESDYFLPPQNGQLSPSLSDASSVSDRHSYIKTQPMPLKFVSNRPNIFLRKPSRANGSDDFDFLSSTLVDKKDDAGADADEVDFAPDAAHKSAGSVRSVADDVSQTDELRDLSSVTLNLNVRKSLPVVRTYAFYYCDSAASTRNAYVCLLWFPFAFSSIPPLRPPSVDH